MHGDFKTVDSRGNPNNLVKINNRKIANLFTQEFNFMWGDGPGGKTDSLFGKKKPDIPLQQFQIDDVNISVKFSPSPSKTEWHFTANGAIGEVLAQAKQTINLALFVFSDQILSNILSQKNTNGITIKTLIEPDFAYRFYSSGLDMMGITLLDKCRPNPENFPWKKPVYTVGVPNLPPGDRLHHKMAIIDQNIVITGSHNWTANANLNNDETLLIIRNATVAAHYQREFDRLYDTANLGIPTWLKTKVQQQQKACQRPAVPNQAKINLNTATQKELETLPGIGPKTAINIIKFRKKQRFTSLNDLEKVPGIGPKILEKLGDHVTW
jgi:comEA protein